METSLKSAGDGIAPGSAKQTGQPAPKACVAKRRAGLSSLPTARAGISPAVDALFNQLYGLADRAKAPLCDELGRCIDSLQGAVVAEQEGLTGTGPAVSQVAQLASDAPSRDKGPGWLFYEIASSAANVESLLQEAVQQTSEDTGMGPTMIALAVDLVGKMGWLADLGSARLGAMQYRGDADQWLLSPSTREALFGERA